MAPSILSPPLPAPPTNNHKSQYLLDRHLHKSFPLVTSGHGNILALSSGRTIFDATSGAAVACLGYDNKRVIEAVNRQMNTGTPYLCSMMFGSRVVEELCEELVRGMSLGDERWGGRVYLTGSGSEAMEASLKLSRQYFYELDKTTPRINIIARQGSYHGNTLGALSVSGHIGRRAPYLPYLSTNVHHISSCNAYRQRLPSESNASFVTRKARELEAKFLELGPETVIAFVMEPVVGAALGCVPSVPGYMKAMKEVCERYGALFVLDEVMSGMGRTGYLHAWQYEGVVPDIMTCAKGLGGGYQPIGAVLVGGKVVKAVMDGGGQFIHGQTYQGMPVQAAAALEVQRILREEDLISNVRTQGQYLESLLKENLENHPHIGDIRGRGLFWGIEFVKDKSTKEPFLPSLAVAQRVHELALSEPYNMTVYPGTGTADGVNGDHIMIHPSYIVTKEDMEHIARTITAVIEQFFVGTINFKGMEIVELGD